MSSSPRPSPTPCAQEGVRPCAPGALVCHCHEVTVGELRVAIDEGGAGSVEAVGELTKAGKGCGACRCRIGRMLCGLPPNCGGFAFCGRCGCVEVLCACGTAA